MVTSTLRQTIAARKGKFFKHNPPPGDPRYFNNIQKNNHDGGVEGLTDVHCPGGKSFRTGPTITDEPDF